MRGVQGSQADVVISEECRRPGDASESGSAGTDTRTVKEVGHPKILWGHGMSVLLLADVDAALRGPWPTPPRPVSLPSLTLRAACPTDLDGVPRPERLPPPLVQVRVPAPFPSPPPPSTCFPCYMYSFCSTQPPLESLCTLGRCCSGSS